MSEKTYVFGTEGANNSLLASLIPALQNKGVDTGYLLGMLNNGNQGGLFGGRGFEDIIALIIVAAIFGNGNFGFGNGNQQGYANTEREMLMSAIQRNGVDISQLANSLNCSVGKIDAAVGQVATQICQLTGQVGMSSQQIINSIQSGNATLASQICSCCCDVKQLIGESNFLTERGFCNTNQILTKGFSDLGYATQSQTCDIEKAIAASTQQILAGQAAIEKRELQREIATLQEEKQTYKLGNMIAAATNPIAAELESIKCRLPKTEVITATPEYVPVNRSINVAYAPYCGYGFGNYGWNGCQNGSLWG
jgi:hypothetical protein